MPPSEKRNEMKLLGSIPRVQKLYKIHPLFSNLSVKSHPIYISYHHEVHQFQGRTQKVSKKVVRRTNLHPYRESAARPPQRSDLRPMIGGMVVPGYVYKPRIVHFWRKVNKGLQVSEENIWCHVLTGARMSRPLHTKLMAPVEGFVVSNSRLHDRGLVGLDIAYIVSGLIRMLKYVSSIGEVAHKEAA